MSNRFSVSNEILSWLPKYSGKGYEAFLILLSGANGSIDMLHGSSTALRASDPYSKYIL